MGVFDKRVAFKPFEYPELEGYKSAIQHSYWLVSEWNFISDIQDFHVHLSPTERSVVKNAMLAISQIEVSVKRFWARLGEKFPKPEIEQIGATFAESECYDKSTEVLTPSGWVMFSDLPEGERVAQYDAMTGSVTFAVPTSRIRRSYKGVMHHYHSEGTDLMVTPDHELLLMHPQKNFYEKKLSRKGIWGRNYRYPTAGFATPTNPLPFTNRDRLLIAIQADGCLFGCCPSGKGRRDVTFNIKKPRKIERLVKILEEEGIPFHLREGKPGMKVINFQLPEDLTIEVNQIKGFDYLDLSRVGGDYATKFIKELAFWDSSRFDNDAVTYYNANEKAVDKVQALACLCGYSSNKGINRLAEDSLYHPLPGGESKKSAKTVYALCLTKDDKKTIPYRKEVEYDGEVYCLTVPAGNLVTRRNRRVAIAGNCRHSDAYSHLLTLLGFNDEFDQLLENPVIQGRVDYLTKYLKGASDNSNQNYTLTLALFSIFVENVSLFSQFLILKSFHKFRNCLKDIDNVIQATAKEETVHALFGVALIKIIQKENPEWVDETFFKKLERACLKAYTAEEAIIDWIYEAGDLAFLPKESVKEFVRRRFNESLTLLDCPPVFQEDPSHTPVFKWFDEEMYATLAVDFFNKKSVAYSKRHSPISSGDLF